MKDGEKCPAGKVVKTEADCQAAAKELKLTYGRSFKNINIHLGCNVVKSRNQVFFNQDLNAKGTDNNALAICSGWLSLLILMYLK